MHVANARHINIQGWQGLCLGHNSRVYWLMLCIGFSFCYGVQVVMVPASIPLKEQLHLKWNAHSLFSVLLN